MEINIGDTVSVDQKDAYVPDDPWTHPVQLGMLLTQLSWEESNPVDSPFVGKVVQIIKSKWFGLIKLKKPVYVVKLRLKYTCDNCIHTTNPKISPHS